MRFYGLRDIDNLPHLQNLSDEAKFQIKVVSHVLPFRTNNYVIEELIDWNNVPDDPIFRLTFPQAEMLDNEHFSLIADAINNNLPPEKIKKIANKIRFELNPHPAGQMTINVPLVDNEPIMGVQHKYKETCLVFPSSGQTCHAYCTFCFRWAQFIGDSDLKFATDESMKFQKYIRENKQLTDILFTGGDPMVMSPAKLAVYILPLLEPEFDHIRNIRIGTKSIGYWPYKYVSDKDSADLLRLFERVIASGKHLAIMAHFSHGVELETPIAHEAIRLIRSTGAEIRSQSPVLRNINDSSEVWIEMWKEQIKQGIIPYYMFVERDTGAKQYFELPLVDAFDIFRNAYKSLSGLSRTVRGPSMSAFPGKIVIEGISEVYGEKVFVLNFLQARNPDWVRRPFFAKYSETATWLDDLVPAFGEQKFFYEDELKEIVKKRESLKSSYYLESVHEHDVA
jgi:KamA family protein